MSTAAERLREAGYRVTGPRLLVHGTLASIGGHRSADEVLAAVRAAGHALPRASVYNSLEALRAAGLVMVADAGPGRTLYEVADHWHHHFVCTTCGTVTDVACVVGAKPCLDADVPGAVIDEAQVIFRGTCAACRRRQ